MKSRDALEGLPSGLGKAADTPALWAPDGLVEALRLDQTVCDALTVAVIPTVTA